jgi:allophanate hydrolase subunit 2
VIELISASALATVQDQGRLGSLKFGVGTSGAMDQLALAAGNLLLGNAMTDAAVELQVFPVRWRFHERTRFALTGADTRATLNGRPLPPWWISQAAKGDCLELGRAVHGSRAYLCLPGGIDVPVVLGSRSTQLRAHSGAWTAVSCARATVWRRFGMRVLDVWTSVSYHRRAQCRWESVG